MMSPQKPAGAIQMARLQMSVCIKLLTQALQKVGAMGEEGTAIMKAIQTLAKVVGKQEGATEDLLPMEQKTVSAGLPSATAAAGAPPGAPPAAGAAPPQAMPPPMAA